jgi:RNA polymerase sigma-70 factor (ECF subfamily)
LSKVPFKNPRRGTCSGPSDFLPANVGDDLERGGPVPPHELTESLAWCARAKGDRDAVLHILTRGYGAGLRRYCGRLLGDDEQAEDVCQTVLLQAFIDLPSFSGRSSFRVWLYSIARHRCLDILKAVRIRQRYVVGEAAVPEPRDAHGTPEELLLREATYACLREELQRLPARSREALLLRYYEQLSYEEMAQRCEDQPATLRVRVSRALLQLRRSLESQTPCNP